MVSVKIVLTCPCLPYNKALEGNVTGVYFISIKIPPSKEKRYHAYSLRVKGIMYTHTYIYHNLCLML
jgi:hypothetical protein